MPTIRSGTKSVEPKPGESVLEALNRAGVNVPSHCRVGACQTCLVRAIEGTPPASAVDGLSDPLRKKGYFFSCIAIASEDLTVATSYL